MKIKNNPDNFVREEKDVEKVRDTVAEIILISELPLAKDLSEKVAKMSAEQFGKFLDEYSPMPLPFAEVSPEALIQTDNSDEKFKEGTNFWINLYKTPVAGHYSTVGAIKVVCLLFPDIYKLYVDDKDCLFVVSDDYMERVTSGTTLGLPLNHTRQDMPKSLHELYL